MFVIDMCTHVHNYVCDWYMYTKISTMLLNSHSPVHNMNSWYMSIHI